MLNHILLCTVTLVYIYIFFVFFFISNQFEISLWTLSMTTKSASVNYIRSALSQRSQMGYERPLIVGISGPQGSGKTFLTRQIKEELERADASLKVILFLMDDMYLTHSDQNKLNEFAQKSMGNNPLLRGRGLPGTHDLQLVKKIFTDLLNLKSVEIPVYDKGLYQGRGDRLAHNFWTKVKTPPDLILFEGWFNGFLSLRKEELKTSYYDHDNKEKVFRKHQLSHLEQINEMLQTYLSLWSYFDYFVCLKTSSLKNVYEWRLEQEESLRKSRKDTSGMTDDEIIKFVDKFMPLYELFYYHLCANGCVKKKDHNLVLEISKDRALLNSKMI